MIQPFLKWAGGKRQLLPEIRKYIPKNFLHYYEPFIGAGAVLFDLQPKQATINDVNHELINIYEVIRDDVDGLLKDLRRHKNESDYFYEIRSLDRSEDYASLSAVERASRLIYLNKTCYNGLYRVNSKGQFNAPFGKYHSPNIVNEDVLRDVSDYLNRANIKMRNVDFAEAVQEAKKGDFIYFDPPYDPLSETASFTSYSNKGFTRADQKRLRDLYVELHERGCYVLLSNSDTPFIRELYEKITPKINVVSVQATRAINSQAAKRGKIGELLVTNMNSNNG